MSTFRRWSLTDVEVCSVWTKDLLSVLQWIGGAVFKLKTSLVIDAIK